MPIDLQPVTSSAIDAHGYDPASRTLAIVFKGGRRRDYPGVPQETADAFRTAPSVGTAFNQLIARKFPPLPPPAADDDEGAAPD